MVASTQAWALKLDLLLSFWLLQPLWAALAWLLAMVSGAGAGAGRGGEQAPVMGMAELPIDLHPTPTAQVGLRQPARQLPGVNTRPYAQPAALEPRSPETCAAEPASSTSGKGGSAGGAAEAEEGRVIERRTFARAFPNGAAVWRQLTRPVRLQEACFRDVVLLYRSESALIQAAHRSRRGTAASGAAGQEADEEAELPDVEGGVGGVADEVRCWGVAAGA